MAVAAHVFCFQHSGRGRLTSRGQPNIGRDPFSKKEKKFSQLWLELTGSIGAAELGTATSFD